MKNYTFALIAGFLFTNAVDAQTAGAFNDPRDGQTYKTISFKNPVTGVTITWMAQNLNFKTPGGCAYDENRRDRKALGLLYTWAAAKKACPKVGIWRQTANGLCS